MKKSCVLNRRSGRTREVPAIRLQPAARQEHVRTQRGGQTARWRVFEQMRIF